MLKALELENFKGIRETVRIEVNPITLLFGPNSSGKSTILQGLLYLREILERENVDADKTEVGGDLVDLGGFLNIVHQHDRDRRIRLKAEIDLKQSLFPKYVSEELLSLIPDNESIDLDASAEWCSVEVEVSWSALLEKPIVSLYRTSINGYHVATIKSSADGREVTLEELNYAHPLFFTAADLEDPDVVGEDKVESVEQALERNATPSFGYWVESLQMVPFGDSPARYNRLFEMQSALPAWDKPLPIRLPPVKLRIEDDSALDEDALQTMMVLPILSQAIVGPGEVLKKLLQEVIHVGPLREVPIRSYVPPKTTERHRWASGIGAWDELLKADSAFVEVTSSWLSDEKRLNTGYSLHRAQYKKFDTETPLYVALQSGRAFDDLDDLKSELDKLSTHSDLVLREEESHLDVAPHDVGVGISQVLPVVVAALQNNSDIVSIEQPELHIHPAVQVKLGDLLLSSIKKRNRLFIVETHSEHLMLRLLRRVRETSEGELPPDAPEAHPNDIAVLCVEQSDGRVEVDQIAVDSSGEFSSRWKRGFFEERVEEIF